MPLGCDKDLDAPKHVRMAYEPHNVLVFIKSIKDNFYQSSLQNFTLETILQQVSEMKNVSKILSLARYFLFEGCQPSLIVKISNFTRSDGIW